MLRHANKFFSKKKLFSLLYILQTENSFVQSLAYANLAGLAPEYGLYSSCLSIMFYTIFGTAKDVSVGPTAVVSIPVEYFFVKYKKKLKI